MNVRVYDLESKILKIWTEKMGCQLLQLIRGTNFNISSEFTPYQQDGRYRP